MPPQNSVVAMSWFSSKSPNRSGYRPRARVNTQCHKCALCACMLCGCILYCYRSESIGWAERWARRYEARQATSDACSCCAWVPWCRCRRRCRRIAFACMPFTVIMLWPLHMAECTQHAVHSRRCEIGRSLECTQHTTTDTSNNTQTNQPRDASCKRCARIGSLFECMIYGYGILRAHCTLCTHESSLLTRHRRRLFYLESR